MTAEEQRDQEFYRELWRALIIVVRAMMRRWGFKPPHFDE